MARVNFLLRWIIYGHWTHSILKMNIRDIVRFWPLYIRASNGTRPSADTMFMRITCDISNFCDIICSSIMVTFVKNESYYAFTFFQCDKYDYMTYALYMQSKFSWTKDISSIPNPCRINCCHEWNISCCLKVLWHLAIWNIYESKPMFSCILQWRLLWIQRLIDIQPELMQTFIQYRTIFDHVITARDYNSRFQNVYLIVKSIFVMHR